jgi:predicted metal-dependent hydrolase
MPSIAITVPHKLTTDEALRRLQGFVEKLKQQYANMLTESNEKWEGNNGKFNYTIMGNKVSGTVNISPSEVTLNANLPMMAFPFKSKIEAAVREQLTQLLNQP